MCQMGIKTCLGCRNGKNKTTDEQHDDRVGKTGHDVLVTEQLPHLLLIDHGFDTAVRGEEQQEHHDEDGGGP